jgi:hypothetical protein
VKLCVALGAAAYVAFPGCDAWIVHVPKAISVTVVPVFVQTDAVRDEKLTGRPEDAVALTAKGGVPKLRLLKVPKLIVCDIPAIVIAKVCVASGGTLLLAVNIPAKVPTVFGVPLMSPLVALSESPVGSADAVTLNVAAGEPFAVSVKL